MSEPGDPASDPVDGLAPRGGFVELFTPKLITVLREGYGAAELRADAMAGLTVAIVALPLSMAIAVASGATPAQGLHTAIIGGFLVSLLGGSRFQIGGPAGAFIVLVASTTALHGVNGLILATFLSGAMLAVGGLLRLGTLVRFVPFPVTVGFTAGIALVIFISQLPELLGLEAGSGPGSLLERLSALRVALPTLSPAAAALSGATIAMIVILKRLRPRWPGMLIAVTAAALATALLTLPVATIGTRFGGIPVGLPAPALPDLSWGRIVAVLPAAVSFALLGSIESLLSAVVADGMTGRRHRSNCELVAQGIANVGSALFGGICVTGTIARTATNVRAGAHGPVAGMLHALFLLVFVLVAAPLAAFVPLATLAGVLIVVAWNMVEKPAVAVLLRSGRGEAAVLAITFLLTVFRDLTEAIVAGVALGSVLFIRRMSRTVAVQTHMPYVGEDVADDVAPRGDYDEASADDPHVVVHRISGALFFGVAASIGVLLERISDPRATVIVDLSAVPFLDASGASVLAGLARKIRRRDARLWITGAGAEVASALRAHGLRPPLCHFAPTVDEARHREAERPDEDRSSQLSDDGD